MTPIHIERLVKRFGATTAVDGISLDIAAGDLFFLLGPSGCGKTTLLRMIAGFTLPTAGLIRFGDRDVSQLPPHQRNTGMVFQGYALWPHMTVRQNVAFGLDVRKTPAEEKTRRVDAALARVQMSHLADRKPNQLSGGQQQRVALARALVIEPTVLLLDEPLSNLDAKLRLSMRSQIRDICKQAGITAVYVTHDQKEALSMADRVAVLKDGKVMQAGPPRTLYQRPANRFVADFLGETNFIPANVLGAEGDAVVLECPAGKFRCRPTPGETPRVPPTGNVTCSIRPEALHVTPATADHVPANDGANAFFTKARGVTYLGEMAQFDLALTDDLPLKAFHLNPGPALSLTPGDGTVVTFDPADVVILQD